MSLKNCLKKAKRDPMPFYPRAPHHGYIGLFILFLAWTMWSYDYYHPLCEYLAYIGLFITIDDLVEHTIHRKTPLRLFFEKILYPLLQRLKVVA